MVAGAVLAFALVGFFLWGYLSDIGGDSDDSAVEEVAEGEEALAETAAPADAAPAEAATAAQDSAAAPAPAATSADGSGSAAAGTDQAAPAGDQPADQTAGQAAGETGDQAASEDQVPPEAAAADVAEPDAAQVQQATAAEGDASAKVVLRARLESWVQITNEKGEAIFSRVLRAGETYTVPAEPGLMMTTGNAGGIEILLDGKKLKSLGSVGLVRRDFPLDPKKLKDGSAFKPGTNAQTTQ
jgi:cytoskeleton protein RodZ